MDRNMEENKVEISKLCQIIGEKEILISMLRDRIKQLEFLVDTLKKEQEGDKV